MKFRSKVDWWLHLIFVAFLAVNIWAIVGVFVGDFGTIIIAIVFTPLSVFLIVPIWLNTYYLLDEDELLVRGGLGRGTRIGYNQITSICETRNPISSPALSLDRLEIRFKSKSGSFSDTIIISPRDKQGFIEQLRIKNGNIKVEEQPISKFSKTILTVAGVVSVMIFVGVCAMFVSGLREPVVTVQDDNIQINAMYGMDVDFSSIADISLLSESMREIGAGRRINGFNGGSWRGHFAAGLLFVTPDSSPTIRIEKNSGSTIFISFRDDERTMMLFQELSALDISSSSE